jgi:hypothetical protein
LRYSDGMRTPYEHAARILPRRTGTTHPSTHWPRSRRDQQLSTDRHLNPRLAESLSAIRDGMRVESSKGPSFKPINYQLLALFQPHQPNWFILATGLPMEANVFPSSFLPPPRHRWNFPNPWCSAMDVPAATHDWIVRSPDQLGWRSISRTLQPGVAISHHQPVLQGDS